MPVIAIFTKFDDLMTQIYDIDQDDEVNRQNAEEQVEKKFRKPLYEYTFPPRADVCFEGKCRLISVHRPYGSTFNAMADLHSETGNHQDQVKVLIEKTASSLDDTALKMLFVSVQQNNFDLCVRYAINEYVMPVFLYCLWHLTMNFLSLIDKIGNYSTVCWRHRNLNDCVRLNLIQEILIFCTLSWFAHSYVSVYSIHWTGYWLLVWNSHEWVWVQNL